MADEDEPDLTPEADRANQVAALTARLDGVVTRVEAISATVQRALEDQGESVATLSRAVGGVSSELGGTVGEILAALTQTRDLMRTSDDATRALGSGIRQANQRFVEVLEELREISTRQAAAPSPVDAVKTELAGALSFVVEELTSRLDGLASELPTLGDRPVAEVASLRHDVERLVAEVHEDRALLTQRLAGRKDLEELRELLTGRTDVDELRELITAQQNRQTEPVDSSAEERVVDRVRGEIEALGDRVETAVTRLASGERRMDDLRAVLDEDLPDRLQRDVITAATDIRKDNETLAAELHDDLALVMRQVVAGNREMEDLRAAIDALAEGSAEHGVDPDAVASRLDAATATLRADLATAVQELHDDLGLVLKRLASREREVDDVRELISAREPHAPMPATVSPGDVAAAVRDEIDTALEGLRDDLGALVRSVAAEQTELGGLRGELVAGQQELAGLRDDLAEAMAAGAEDGGGEAEGGAAAVEELRLEIMEGLAAVASDIRDEIDSVRSLAAARTPTQALTGIQGELASLRAELKDALAAAAEAAEDAEGPAVDLAEAISAVNEDLATRLDQLGALLRRRPHPVDVRSELAPVISQLQREMSALMRQMLAGQEDVQTLRDELVAAIADLPAHAAPPPPPEPVEPLDVRGEVAPLLAEVHEDLAAVSRQVALGQEDVQALRDELVGAIAELPAPRLPASTEPVDVRAEVEDLVGELHEDLATVLRQVVAGQDEVQGLRDELVAAVADLPAPSAPPAEPVDVRAEVEDLVGELHEDLATVLGQVVAGQEEVRALRDELAAAVADLSEPLAPAPSVAVLPPGLEDDISALVGQVAGTQLEIRSLRDELGLVAAGGRGDGLAEALQDDLAALVRQAVASQEEVQALRDDLAATVTALSPGIEDDLGALVGQVAAIQIEVQALRDGLGEPPAAPGLPSEVEALVVDLPELVARELRGEFGTVIGELHDDLGQLMRQVVAGQDEVSQLRAEVAELPAAESEPTDVTGVVAAVAADLRGDIEALVGELHEDMATVLRQVIAGQEEVEALRELLAELPPAGATGVEVSADLDRLSRDLQALRERIPGAAAPAARRRRSPAR